MRVMQVLSSRRDWRGGERQACLLANGLAEQMPSYLLAPPAHPVFAHLNHKVHAVPLTIGNGFRLQALLPFVQLVRRNNIALLDFHSSHGHNFALLISRLLPRVKIIVHRHTNFAPSRGLSSRYKYLHGGVDHFICVSHAARATLLRSGIPPPRVSTVRAAVAAYDCSPASKQQHKQEICRRYALDPTQPLLGTAAALLEQKGYPTLLRALQLIKNAGIDFQALFCGEGADRGKIESLCATLGLQREIRLAGFVTEILPTLAALDIFCLPSTNEGLGLAVQEAAHAGCCIVATAVGGITEMLEHEHSGLLSPAGDVPALAANLKRALTDSATRARLAANSKRTIAQQFSVNAMVAASVRVYTQVRNA